MCNESNDYHGRTRKYNEGLKIRLIFLYMIETLHIYHVICLHLFLIIPAYNKMSCMVICFNRVLSIPEQLLFHSTMYINHLWEYTSRCIDTFSMWLFIRFHATLIILNIIKMQSICANRIILNLIRCNLLSLNIRMGNSYWTWQSTKFKYFS